MKKFLSFFLLVVFANFAQAQISDDEAKQVYQDAEEQYEAGNYYKCYQMCNDLIVKMGNPNPRLLYLDLKAIYNNLEKKNDKSEYTLKKNYKNYLRFSGYADDFFSLVDKNTYPTDKYNEIVEIKKYLDAGMKEYEYEKNRKPEDAISFLNECSQKFYRTDHDTKYVTDGKGDCHVNFSLDSSKLIINVTATITGDGAKYNEVGYERIIIDLSKVWIEVQPLDYYWKYDVFFYLEFGNISMFDVKEKYKLTYPRTDDNAPMITSTKTYINNKAKIDNILWHFSHHYDKKMKIENEDFEKYVKSDGFSKLSAGFYIYNLFDQSSDEFRDGNYKKRIKDAFEFLIDYYGGGTPTENKQENKSKF
jgi:hypothetical protein